MPDTLPSLEKQKTQLLHEISQLGDLRRGSITTLTRRCGKPGCRCAQPDSPPHGPNYRLTRYVNGKYVSESFSSPAALHKAQREVAAHHKFRELCRCFVEVNEKICRLRPVEQEQEPAASLTPREKKRPRRSNKKLPKK